MAGLGGFVMFTAVMCLLWLLLRQRVRNRHRVDPGVATEAPLLWSVGLRSPARLHRRLARVGTALGKVIDDHRVKGRRRNREQPPILSVATELRAQAVALDRELARTAQLAPTVRREPLRRLSEQVAEVENSSAQLVSLSAELQAPRMLSGDDPAVIEISQRVDRLAQAHAELKALDEAAGIATTATFPPPAPTEPASRLGGRRSERSADGQRSMER